MNVPENRFPPIVETTTGPEFEAKNTQFTAVIMPFVEFTEGTPLSEQLFSVIAPAPPIFIAALFTFDEKLPEVEITEEFTTSVPPPVTFIAFAFAPVEGPPVMFPITVNVPVPPKLMTPLPLPEILEVRLPVRFNVAGVSAVKFNA